MTIEENLDVIINNINNACVKYGQKFDDVELIAVSKKVDIEKIKIAQNYGVKSFGESYVQELLSKIEQIDNVNWHFIGQLQSNKVKYIIREIYMLHSLDRMSLARELEKELAKHDIRRKVLVQVNISREGQKGGVMPENVERFLDELTQFKSLDVCGLMCIPAANNSVEETERDFAATRNIYDKLKSIGFDMRYLSMGMSHDYVNAIKFGANLVRVGTAIFGERT